MWDVVEEPCLVLGNASEVVRWRVETRATVSEAGGRWRVKTGETVSEAGGRWRVKTGETITVSELRSWKVDRLRQVRLCLKVEG